MDILVAYDIDTTTLEGERRLVRVARICEGYGTRAQYSVFECRLSPARLESLVAELRAAIDRSSDSVNVYRFDGPLPAARASLGRRPSHELGEPWIL